MRQLLLLFIALIFLVMALSCNNQGNGNISANELKNILEREKKNQDRAKYGGHQAEIEIITNPQKVQHLKNYISRKKSEERKKALAKSQNKTLVERYKTGDQSAIPQIIETLKGQDLKAKKMIYHHLSRRYDESDNYQIIEPELIKAILNNITLPEEENQVIQLAGFMNLNGHLEIFEERLLSGKSKDESRLMYWLGKEGSSLKSLDYFEKIILAEDFKFDENHNMMSGIEAFAKNGTSEAKEKALEIALAIYHKKIIPAKKFEEMKTIWSSANPAIDLTKILLESTDQRVIPIAKQFIKEEISVDKALVALIQLEAAPPKDLIFEFLKKEGPFFDALHLATEWYKISKDKKIVETILIEFEKRDKHPDNLIDRLVSALIAMDATEYFSELDAIIKNKQLAELISKQYRMAAASIENVAEDLYKFGVIANPISNEIIEKAKKISEADEIEGDIYNLLYVSNLYQWFDAEVGIVPVDYDDLILQFAKNSNGKLKDIEVWMDADMDKDYHVQYQIFVSNNDRIYIMSPKDIGDWYDIEMTLNLMNTIAKDANLKERFVLIKTGDQTVQILFGPRHNVNQFIEKYNI